MRRVILFFLAWTMGICLGGFLSILILFKRIKIRGYSWKKFIPRKGMIVICNHPSAAEPGILPLLFLPWCLTFPRLIPISTPEKDNYFRLLFLFFQPFCIWVERKDPRKMLRILKEMRQVVEKKGVLILFPESGRTFKGEKFVSLENRRIREFPLAISRIFNGLDCLILPIWVEGTENILPNEWDFSKQKPFFRFWRKAGVTIGEVIDSRALPKKKEINQFLEDVLLRV